MANSILDIPFLRHPCRANTVNGHCTLYYSCKIVNQLVFLLKENESSHNDHGEFTKHIYFGKKLRNELLMLMCFKIISVSPLGTTFHVRIEMFIE